ARGARVSTEAVLRRTQAIGAEWRGLLSHENPRASQPHQPARTEKARRPIEADTFPARHSQQPRRRSRIVRWKTRQPSLIADQCTARFDYNASPNPPSCRPRRFGVAVGEGRQSRRHKITLKMRRSRPAGLRDLGLGLNALHHHDWSEAQGEAHDMREAVTTIGRRLVIV